MNPVDILTKIDPFRTPTKILAEIAIQNSAKGTIYTSQIPVSFQIGYLYCITVGMNQNKWPVKCLDVRINNEKVDIKREGTPVII